MEKFKINYKTLLKCLIITVLSIGYIMYAFLFLLFLLFPIEWCTITNLAAVLCFLSQTLIFVYCIFCIRKNKIKRSTALIIVFILLCPIPKIVLNVEKNTSSNFTPSRWERRVKSRFLMVDDMLEKNKLLGRNKNDILELLGNETPPEDIQINTSNNTYEDHLVYYLGKPVDGVFHTEDDYLVIYFKNDVVEEHKILKDTFDF